MTSSSWLASALLHCPSSSPIPRKFFAPFPSQLHFSTHSSNIGCCHRLYLTVRSYSYEPEFWATASELEEEFGPMEVEWGEVMDVEEEIYEFMVQSDNPDLFPTKEELLAAGREDLVSAISVQGGWLVLGWEIDDDDEGGEEEMDRKGARAGGTATSSGRKMELESSGVEGILCELEKQRRLSFGATSVTNEESLIEEEKPLGKLDELSDTWEFQQTKIMKIRDKLRSIRVNLAVLEGKMAGGTNEAQQPVKEEPKDTNEANEDWSLPKEANEAHKDLNPADKMNEAKKDLSQLRIVYIVWAYPASEVLLAGSFDGWSSQRKLERSMSGSFSLQLKLYPGRYQIKFIVDGVWKIDPNQPIIHSHGFVNNFLSPLNTKLIGTSSDQEFHFLGRKWHLHNSLT